MGVGGRQGWSRSQPVLIAFSRQNHPKKAFTCCWHRAETFGKMSLEQKLVPAINPSEMTIMYLGSKNLMTIVSSV